MKRIQCLMIGLLLISLFSHGSESDSVVVFHGRGQLMESQKILDLSNQNLKKVPIGALNPEIETLILDNNHIKDLPLWIGDLKNLKILSIRNNSLEKLDYAITSCENLEQLYLTGNKNLSDISNINTSQKLEIIDVVGTKINEMPAWIQMMNHLLYFKFTGKHK
jgi:Leucine-rich repeat (LRR) protein